MANHDGPTTRLLDGLVVVQNVCFDEDGSPPYESADTVGTLVRADRRRRYEFLSDYAIDEFGRVDLSCRFDDMAEALGCVERDLALPLYTLLADQLPADSVWHKKGAALLAMLRLGGAGDEPLCNAASVVSDGSPAQPINHLGGAVAVVQERLSNMFSMGSDYRLTDELDQSLRRLATTLRCDMLRNDPLTVDAVLLKCRGFDTSYERDWDVVCLVGDHEAPDTFEDVFGIWTPDEYLRAELNACKNPTGRRLKALQFAREYLVAHNHYIDGDVFVFNVSVYKPLAAAADGDVTSLSDAERVCLDAAQYVGQEPLATQTVGTFYGLDDVESGLDDAVASATQVAVRQALNTLAKKKTARSSRRRGNTTRSEALRLSP